MTSLPEPLSPLNVTVTSLTATARSRRSKERITGDAITGSITTSGVRAFFVIAGSLRGPRSSYGAALSNFGATCYRSYDILSDSAEGDGTRADRSR